MLDCCICSARALRKFAKRQSAPMPMKHALCCKLIQTRDRAFAVNAFGDEMTFVHIIIAHDASFDSIQATHDFYGYIDPPPISRTPRN
jgi:hypothetical protein